jgi:hypothetical protein
LQRFSFSPNPTSEAITIQFPQSVPPVVFSLKLFNLAGTLVKTAAVQPGTKKLALDVAAFPPGLYLLVYEENGVAVQRR